MTSIAAMLSALILLLSSMTGINRTVDPQLSALAQQRSQEIVTNFNHRPLDLPGAWGEVIGWNRHCDDPVACIAQDWRDSPEHWTIIDNPFYNHIGCGLTIENDTYWFVCIVMHVDGTNSSEQAPKTAPRQAPTPALAVHAPKASAPQEMTMPNTSIR